MEGSLVATLTTGTDPDNFSGSEWTCPLPLDLAIVGFRGRPGCSINRRRTDDGRPQLE
ncbi:hypothetical protein BN381_210024 [Candidatus Microthrix parvicella RN1]|uniref:Uncharacterized protein n=1 Tax=Candidatus Neomicrothrix parvicella RN1 TaxID=1229780 RepID=R4YXX6_9ACTN|nr:hypothetical protein BN381_210024 [Candidatus Microthrix parvicella RN1]